MAWSNAPTDKLFSLLPATIRAGDEAAGGSLRALLALVEEAAVLVEADISQLGANAFIETAEPWAVPYIGALIGWTPLGTGDAGAASTAAELFPDLAGPDLTWPSPYRPRADVGRTIHYRRRKGTLATIEALAADVTGWRARAVEGFSRLAATQWLGGPRRLDRPATASLRDAWTIGRISGAFAEAPATIDVRAIGPVEGWPGLRAVAIFLWRLMSLPVEDADARSADEEGWRFRCHPLGLDAPLFARGRTPAGPAREPDMPGPIRPGDFHRDLVASGTASSTDYYGPFAAGDLVAAEAPPSIHVAIAGEPVVPSRVRCADLSDWLRPSADHVAIDVRSGRIALGPDCAAGPVRVGWHEGRPGPVGGGGYARSAWLIAPASRGQVYPVAADGAGDAHPTLAAALAAWTDDGRPSATIELRDSRSYAETPIIDFADASGVALAIEAVALARPHLRMDGPLEVLGGGANVALTLSGLLIEGGLHVTGALARLRVLHSTLAPSELPAVLVEAGGAGGFALEMACSVSGGLALPEEGARATILDSIVDGGDGTAIGGGDGLAPLLRLERTTVIGAVAARQVEFVTDCIFDGPVTIARTQAGCVRHSWLRPDAKSPRRYRCEPDLSERRAIEAAGTADPATRAALIAGVRARVVPSFASRRYGRPDYIQLTRGCAPALLQGAEAGGEMGVWCQAGATLRKANLRVRLDEYLPVGLDAGTVDIS